MEKRGKEMKTDAACKSGERTGILHPFRGAINRSVRQPGFYPAVFFFCRPIRKPVSTSSRESPVLTRR